MQTYMSLSASHRKHFNNDVFIHFESFPYKEKKRRLPKAIREKLFKVK